LCVLCIIGYVLAVRYMKERIKWKSSSTTTGPNVIFTARRYAISSALLGVVVCLCYTRVGILYRNG